jgi:hypothetical protein
MKQRSVIAVVLLPFVTLGIYTWYWLVSTKGELNERGAEIPTAWLILIPLVNIYWLWKYYEGAQKVSNEKISGVLMFVLHLFVAGVVSAAICQDTYNKMTSPVAGDMPQGASGTPVA